ncbi:MAG: hypothetical protein FJY10_09375 [Bacteroidetes bacterium]|nr:hypothetical protein [Bacteroidota bacterium]
MEASDSGLWLRIQVAFGGCIDNQGEKTRHFPAFFGHFRGDVAFLFAKNLHCYLPLTYVCVFVA